MHRVGDWKERGAHRRCLTVDEMKAKGWSQKDDGFWITRKRDTAALGRIAGEDIFADPPPEEGVESGGVADNT